MSQVGWRESRRPASGPESILHSDCVPADSDDSDNEGGLGNVERVVMRPPGHSGKAKKGHLCFDAIYETGIDKPAVI